MPFILWSIQFDKKNTTNNFKLQNQLALMQLITKKWKLHHYSIGTFRAVKGLLSLSSTTLDPGEVTDSATDFQCTCVRLSAVRSALCERAVLSGKKFVTYFFIDKPCNILPNWWYIYCPETLLDHSNFTSDLEVVTFSFLIFTQNIVILNENSINLMGNSMANSQIIWVITKNTKHWLEKDYKICLYLFLTDEIQRVS